jgi:iron complex outermembrane receptor protein
MIGYAKQISRVAAWLFLRNLFYRNYMQNLTVQAGNSGLIVGTPSDPRTCGFTPPAKF